MEDDIPCHSIFQQQLARRSRPSSMLVGTAIGATRSPRRVSAKDRLPSVDARFHARENVGIVAARGRMLSSVRPVMRQDDRRRPVWEFADRVQITHSVSQPRLADCCAVLSFRSPSRPRDRGQPTPLRSGFCRGPLGVMGWTPPDGIYVPR